MREIYYTGIGSRECPEDVLQIMEKIGEILAKIGYVLRSGGANGADSAFEKGCDRVKGKKEIYLPWKGFNNNSSLLYDLTAKAEELAFQYHPNLYACKSAVIKLMTRNTYQILGQDCRTKSDFVVCYTADGKASGGTGQALRIAIAEKIPIFNLHEKENLNKMKDFVNQLIN